MRLIITLLLLGLISCSQKKTENNRKKSHPSHAYNYVDVDTSTLNYYETRYLPVYSYIYHRDGTRKFDLTTTISIRNNSLTDSVYLFSSTYHDSYGLLLREYTDSTIMLIPLESIEYVVEELKEGGGAGANFIISWGAHRNSDQLLVQSIMIGTNEQQGISFITNGKIIESLHK